MRENNPNLEECKKEASRLTELLEAQPAFSFLRLGDGEIQCITAVSRGGAPPRYSYGQRAFSGVEAAFSVSGIEERHFPRLFAALNNCTYLDYCDSIRVNREEIPSLGIVREETAFHNPSPSASNIVFAWTAFELPDYLRRHKCLFAGAESALLKELLTDSAYRRIAADHWPEDGDWSFHQVRNDGRFFSENLDSIKDDLKREIDKTGCDTLLLSLATGAKILCYELAKELGIRAVDFGSMPRALSYAGMPGYAASRNFHNPFLFRVPFRTYMAALERAHPSLSVPSLISRAHGQMALEIQDLSPFSFNTSDALTGIVDMSPARLSAFKDALRDYNEKYRRLAFSNEESRTLHEQFVLWRRKKGIGVDGKLFLLLVKAKGLLRRLLGEKWVPVTVRKQHDLWNG